MEQSGAELIEQMPIVWKKIVYNGRTFECKYVNDVLVLKIERVINQFGNTSSITYEGTFNEKYELHGDNCIYNNDNNGNDYFKNYCKGTFENGEFKKGVYKDCYITIIGIFEKDIRGGVRIVSGEKITSDYTYSGEFYDNGKLKKGTVVTSSGGGGVKCDGEFDVDGKLLQGKIINENYGNVYIKEGIFSADANYVNRYYFIEYCNLTTGKQTLHNKVIMEGTFEKEQLRHGKVTYPDGKTLEGDFTNGLFDSDGTFHKHSRYLKGFKKDTYGKLHQVPRRGHSHNCIVS